ncbi:MAG: hypothetical protein NT154_15515 [Verrucomicrobia bacterium]|nr:hypothetical protein [Verrucomicrobiota bacterium]
MTKFVISIVLMAGFCCAVQGVPAVEVKEDASGQVILSNDAVSLAFNLTNGTYAITDKAKGLVVIDRAGVAADGWEGKNMRFSWTQEEAKDAFGEGRRLVLAMEHPGKRALPVYLFSYAVYEGKGAVVMGFGLRNTMKHGVRLMKVAPRGRRAADRAGAKSGVPKQPAVDRHVGREASVGRVGRPGLQGVWEMG